MQSLSRIKLSVHVCPVTQSFPSSPVSTSSKAGSEQLHIFILLLFPVTPMSSTHEACVPGRGYGHIFFLLCLLLALLRLLNAMPRTQLSSNGHFHIYLPHWSLLWCPQLNWGHTVFFKCLMILSMSNVSFILWVNELRAGPFYTCLPQATDTGLHTHLSSFHVTHFFCVLDWGT